MQIHPSRQSNSQPLPAFGAIKVATGKNCQRGKETSIDIYKLTLKDNAFVNYLENHTNYKELLPDMEEVMQDRWQKVFNYCIRAIKSGDNNSFVAIANNKPCGILTYYQDETVSFLDGVCKIPQEKADKIPLIGKTLILNFLKFANKENSKKVALDAVKDGPIDVISIYEQLGFKKIFRFCDNKYQPMEMHRFKIKDAIRKLENVIDYTEAPVKEEINLLNLVG